MKLRLRTVLAVFLVCILVVPVFAYSAWQPEESFTDNLGGSWFWNCGVRTNRLLKTALARRIFFRIGRSS